MESRDAVTYLLLDGSADDRIAGYYCLSAGSVRRADAPLPIARWAPESVPVVRMGRFAVHADYQGKRWGADLLREAMLSTASGAELIGARALLVDAISAQAAGFYRRFGFIESPIHPLQLFTSIQGIKSSAALS